jgi:hypothetical protein
MKMTDLGKSPSEPMSDKPAKARKFYPSTRVPLSAIKGAPTDGSEFTVTMKVCVRSVDNRDEAADLELKGISLVKGGAQEPSGDSGDTKSRFPKRSLSESVQRAKDGASSAEY